MPDKNLPAGQDPDMKDTASGVEMIQVDNKSFEGLMKLTHDLYEQVKESKKSMAEKYDTLDRIVKDIIEGRAYLKNAHAHEQLAHSNYVGLDLYNFIDAKYYFSEPVTDPSAAKECFNKGMVTPSLDPAIKELQQLSDNVYILGELLGFTDPSQYKGLKMYRRLQDQLGMVGKALSIVSSGSGSDWVPTGFSAELIELVHLELMVAGIHPRQIMPTSPWDRPGATSDTKAYRTTASNSDAAAKFRASQRGTTKVTFTAEKLAVRTLYDVELEEDAIIPLLPSIKSNCAQGIARAIEDTIQNGDVSATTASSALDNTDMHGDSMTVESPAMCWDGYRSRISDQASTCTIAGGGAATDTHVRQARASMGKYGARPADLAVVASVDGYINTILGFTNVRTVDKYGAKATILSGELAKLDGSPVIVSEQARQDLNNSGVSGGATSVNVDSVIVVVNRPQFELAEKRMITVETDKIKGSDQIEVIATWRGDFQSLQGSTGQKVVAQVANLK